MQAENTSTSLPDFITFDGLEASFIDTEIDGYFDDSSLSNREQPQFVAILGGVTSVKTTLRKQSYSHGFVLIDAAEIFLNLGGKYLDFPTALEDAMNVIGNGVARRAIAERRHIVTELVGYNAEATRSVIDAVGALGYRIEVQAVFADPIETWLRNIHRGEDCISAFYTERYHCSWLLEAAEYIAVE